MIPVVAVLAIVVVIACAEKRPEIEIVPRSEWGAIEPDQTKFETASDGRNQVHLRPPDRNAFS